MPTVTDHVQYDEVLRQLNEERACAIVHVPTLHEVVVWADRKSGWAAQATVKDEPSFELQSQLADHGFDVTRQETAFQFGPSKGEMFAVHHVYGKFPDEPSAARNGLALFKILWNVSPDEWLWVTHIEYEQRGTAPPRPNPWPPQRA